MNHQHYGGSTQNDSGRAEISPWLDSYFDDGIGSRVQTYGVFQVILFVKAPLLHSYTQSSMFLKL